ncbi:MAG: TerC family protein [Elusimicrobiota bacterium]|jgi:tellurite resistance protein TerC
MDSRPVLWIAFNLVVAALLWVDLRIFNRRAHVVSFKEAALWSVVWIMTALLFDVGIYYTLGSQKAVEFLTGYIIEKSLSVDNLFVFIMIFAYFGLPERIQPKILHWGILGALAMRFVMIFAGVALLEAFHWVIYVFGALLVYTGAKMMFETEHKVEPGKNIVLRALKKVLPFAEHYDGESFFVKNGARWCATPLFATLVVIEVSDLVFAVDSIPAVLAITTDPFIVYTSNVFAILGLRALYFLLAGTMNLFRYLKTGVAVVLCYVGVKMLAVDFFKIPVSVSLAVIIGILAVSVLASLAVRPARPSAS